MAKEKRSSSQQTDKAGSGAKTNRRRYFRRHKDNTQSGTDEADIKAPAAPVREDETGAKARRDRGRRGRSKRAVVGEASPEVVIIPSEPEMIEQKTVYIYTHVIHPPLREYYEFRPEHFSKVGRKLEDYKIDLSRLFEDDTGNVIDTADNED